MQTGRWVIVSVTYTATCTKCQHRIIYTVRRHEVVSLPKCTCGGSEWLLDRLRPEDACVAQWTPKDHRFLKSLRIAQE